MNNHFTQEKSNIFRLIIAWILMIPTLGFPLWGAYEFFFVPHYWKNRWTLYRLLKKGRVKIKIHGEHSVQENRIVRMTLEIDSIQYEGSLWDRVNMTLEDDYIGLFIGSVGAKYLNSNIVNRLINLSEAQQIKSA
jgi:hypothetical protein